MSDLVPRNPDAVEGEYEAPDQWKQRSEPRVELIYETTEKGWNSMSHSGGYTINVSSPSIVFMSTTGPYFF